MKVIKIVCETEYKFESFLAPNASFNKSVIQPLASKSATKLHISGICVLSPNWT